MIRNKYGNKKVIHKGIKFDSKMERDYYITLISEGWKPILQPKFVLQEKFRDNKGNSIRAITYIGDFQIKDKVIDVKGMETPAFKIKKKLFMKKFPELSLAVVARAPKYCGKSWIELGELVKIRKERKK